MSSDQFLPPGEEDGPRNPRGFLIAGLAAVGLALVLSWTPGGVPTPLRMLCLVVGLLAGAEAVCRGYRSWRVAACSALIAFLAYFALDPAWDSLRMAMGVVVVVALLGTLLAALPERRRWTILSGLVLLHFGAILTAVLAAPHPPWLVEHLRARLYRPYLEFMYLNETYKWFTPEPGPEPILWFRLQYADRSYRWVRLREPGSYATKLEWVRFGSMTASAHQARNPDHAPEDLLKRRRKAGKRLGIPDPGDEPRGHYQPPTPHAALMISSYARYAARNYPHPSDPTQAVAGVKVYGVTRQALSPEQFLEQDSDPFDPTLLSAYYVGEFDVEGKMKPASKRDPFLYWYIPIEKDKNGNVIDYVKVHAGDANAEEAR